MRRECGEGSGRRIFYAAVEPGTHPTGHPFLLRGSPPRRCDRRAVSDPPVLQW